MKTSKKIEQQMLNKSTGEIEDENDASLDHELRL